MTQPEEKCDNCLKMFPQSKIASHFGYCRRNIKRCATCGEMYDINFLEEHEEDYHKNAQCEFCKKKFASNDIAAHKASCLRKPRFCEYCEQLVPIAQFASHLKICESRTKMCEKCKKPISNKQYLIHLTTCQGVVYAQPMKNKNYGDYIDDQRRIDDQRKKSAKQEPNYARVNYQYKGGREEKKESSYNMKKPAEKKQYQYRLPEEKEKPSWKDEYRPQEQKYGQPVPVKFSKNQVPSSYGLNRGDNQKVSINTGSSNSVNSRDPYKGIGAVGRRQVQATNTVTTTNNPATQVNRQKYPVVREPARFQKEKKPTVSVTYKQEEPKGLYPKPIATGTTKTNQVKYPSYQPMPQQPRSNQQPPPIKTSSYYQQNPPNVGYKPSNQPQPQPKPKPPVYNPNPNYYDSNLYPHEFEDIPKTYEIDEDEELQKAIMQSMGNKHLSSRKTELPQELQGQDLMNQSFYQDLDIEKQRALYEDAQKKRSNGSKRY